MCMSPRCVGEGKARLRPQAGRQRRDRERGSVSAGLHSTVMCEALMREIMAIGVAHKIRGVFGFSRFSFAT